MNIWVLILIGLAGGVFGGLGMGGGTLLIPLLVLFTGMGQHAAQTVNLIAFIPMSLVALIIHIKNKMVKFRYLLTISLPATVTSIAAAFFAKNISSGHLARYFGIFLIVLGTIQLIALIIKTVKERKRAQKDDVLQSN